MTQDDKKTILIIDGYHLLHKGFYGSLKRKKIAVNRDGTPINAIYTFIAKINHFLELNKYHTVIVTFDIGKSCWRRELYPEYKAKRKETPPELLPQMQIIREFLSVANIPWYEKETFEGDDVIGTISNVAVKLGYKIHILSNDKDIYQLVNENVQVIVEGSKKEKPQLIGLNEVVSQFGCKPDQVPDLKALMGDSSDNIKGVKSLHYNTAIKLLKKYKTIENIYANIDEISKNQLKVSEKLIDGRDQILMNKKITTIQTNINLGRINFHKLFINWYGYLNFLKKQRMWAFTPTPLAQIKEIEARRKLVNQDNDSLLPINKSQSVNLFNTRKKIN